MYGPLHAQVQSCLQSQLELGARNLQRIQDSATISRRRRQQRILSLQASKDLATPLALALLASVSDVVWHHRLSWAEAVATLERDISSFIAQCTIKARKNVSGAHGQQERDKGKCEMMLEDASMAAKLSAFGIQVERESRGGVSLRQLGRDDAQGRRCIQAALENIRPSFLDRTPFSEMKAVHVYKVENKSLLSRFHTHADGLAPSKIKGLFCSVPESSLERLVVTGFGSGISVSAALPGAVSDIVLGARANDVSPSKLVEYLAAAPPVNLPRSFGRHSSLEDDPPPSRSVGATSDAYCSDARYLVLCRVVVGNIWMGDSECPVSELRKGGFDSVYSPLREEYHILNEACVLPEFILAIRYISGKKVMDGASLTEAIDAQRVEVETLCTMFDRWQERRRII